MCFMVGVHVCVRVGIHVCVLGWAFMYVCLCGHSCMGVRVGVLVCLRDGVHVCVRVGIHVC